LTGGSRQFVATSEFTVADILMTNVLGGGTDQRLVERYPNIVAFRKRYMDRPAWKKTLAGCSERVEAG
jgi:glutathione S-transferase